MSASPCAHASRKNQLANDSDGCCADASSETNLCRPDDDDDDDEVLSVALLVVTALFPLAPLASHTPVFGPFQSLDMMKSTAPLAPAGGGTTNEQPDSSQGGGKSDEERRAWIRGGLLLLP
jgi:hypothetical protein